MFGQKNYLAIQGIGGKYRIDQIGCFLTTISNWLERRGRGINPVDLNAQFIANGTYCDIDDGIRDDLGPYAFHAADAASNCSGWINGIADTNDAIIEFYYQSITHPWLDDARTKPNLITHYCLVANAAAHTFIDSWDGVVKNWDTINYGRPRRFARISVDAPTPVVVQNLPKYQVTETYPDGKQVRLNKEPTNLWGMNWDFEKMVNNPIEVHHLGEVITVTNKVHHVDGYDYYRRADQVDGFNVLDCDDYTPPAPAPDPVPSPTPAAETPALPVLNYVTYPEAKQKRVKKGEPVDIWGFGTATELAQITSTGTLTPGSDFEAAGEVETLGYKFLLTTEDLANKTGHGVFDKDLEDAINPELDPATDIKITTAPDPNAWKATFDTDNKGDWDSEEDYVAYDLSDPTRPGIRVPKGQLIHIVGSFLGPDGNGYCKFTTKTYGTDHWYGIPPKLIGADPIKREDDENLFQTIAGRKPKNVRERVIAWIGLVWDTITLVGKNKNQGAKK
jgi:hypothetical protein